MAKTEKGISVKQIVKERVEILFTRAKEAADENPDLSARYIALARDLCMKQRVRLTQTQRRSICRKCSTYLVPGRNLRVRIQHGKVIYTCGHCGAVVRIPLTKK
ncbi:MAG: ribonuclease P protein component 4 [Methanocorpusculum sp.]|nr:ribonuclease P protein component 4 [Methanocorpusculum sp.]